MIDWDSGIKPWHLVADAGFGAAMEECGFRKVGRSMWRRDGDRIAWRVALTKGYAGTPGSFRDGYGGFVKEVDELVKLYDPKRSLERMEGTSVPMHLGSALSDNLIRELREKEFEPWRRKWQAERINRTGLLGILKDFIKPIPPSPDVDFSEVPFLENVGPSSLDWAFVVRTEAEVSEIAQQLIRIWHQAAMPWIEDRLDFGQAYPRTWGPDSPGTRYYCFENPEFYAAAKLAGDQAWINEMARRAFAQAPKSIDEVWKDCRKRDLFDQPHVVSGEVKPETIVRNRLIGKFSSAVKAMAIADALSIDIPECDVDFSLLPVPVESLR
ncbi:MAG: hypothetical protein DHS20C03_22510 [Minwuia thermotolerans]|nr:MAG: hypothetical protein DHS20C03_22510 [Minwuia thermotolerans]